MNDISYQKELEKIISNLSYRPKLLLHSCCAPCSSYCLIYLLGHFDITCFYYNPNITDKKEYDKRIGELHRLIDAINKEYADSKVLTTPIGVIDGQYEPEEFLNRVEEAGLASCPEGGKRCEMCFTLRLKKTHDTAAAGGFEYFTTTLTISPLKSAKLINNIGYGLAKDVLWLPSDFKKKDGYKKSIELSAKYDLYRQNYCGCEYSKADRTGDDLK